MSNSVLSRLIDSLTTCRHDTTHVRCVRQLEPPSWQGNVVMPPTYSSDDNGGRGIQQEFRIHQEKRFTPDGEKEYVVLDSIPSSANRAEVALLDARQRGVLKFPDIVLVVPSLDNEERSVLKLSHRIYSRFLQQSLHGETPFPATEWGKRVFSLNHRVAALEVARLNPASILFGCWCSNVGTQGHFRFPRCVQMEIAAHMTAKTFRAASTGDAFGIKSFKVFANADTLEVSPNPPSATEAKAKSARLLTVGAKGVEPCGLWHEMPTSNAMLTPIPPVLQHRGVSVSKIEDSFVLELHQLVGFNTGDANRDLKLRVVLATLALAAHALKSQNLALRSGCSLTVPAGSDGKLGYSFIGSKPTEFSLAETEAVDLYKEALDWAKDIKDVYNPDFTLTLKASPKLEEIIDRSRRIASIGKKTKANGSGGDEAAAE